MNEAEKIKSRNAAIRAAVASVKLPKANGNVVSLDAARRAKIREAVIGRNGEQTATFKGVDEEGFANFTLNFEI